MADGEARLRHPLLLDFAEGIDEDGQLLELEESSVQGADGDHDSYHHRKLLEAISHIDGRDSHAVVERSGFTGKPSEFYLQGLDEKLEIADLLPSKNTGGRALQDLKKKLKKLVDAESTLATPTPQHEVQKACRAATYIKAKQVVDKWLPAVLQGRREVSLVLPRGNWNMTKDLARPLHDVTRGSKTPLEQEVWTLLHGTSTPAPFSEAAPVLSRAMCIEEARARRIELQKYRALQSYFEAKARRQHKIKSKTYHRIQKRGRMKDESKQLEKLVNSNDQSAVDKHFQLLDIARIKERMTLRHKNTGKWAKAQALIAKYDPKARAELHEQLMRSKELNRKQLTTTLLDDGSDDEIQSVDEEAKPCNIGSLTNPWMHMSVQFESCATLVGKDKKKEGSEVAEDMKDNEEVVKIDDDDDDDDAFENEQTLCKLQVGSSPRFSQEGQKVFSKEPGNDFEGTEYCEVLFSSCDGNLDASETISKNDGIKPTMKLSKQIGKQNQTINNEVQSKMGKRKRKKCKNKMKSAAKNSIKMSVKSDEHVCLKKREENMVPLDLMEMTTETRGTNCKKKQKTKNAVLKPEQHNKRSDLPIPPSVVSDNVNGKKHDEVHLAFHKLEIVTNKKGNNQIKTAKRTKTTKEKSRRQLNNKKATVEVMERIMKEDHAFSDNLDGEHSVITHADNIDPGQFNTCSIFDYPTKEQCTSKVDNMFEKMKAGNTRRKEGLTEIWDKTKTEQGKGVLIVEDEWEEQKSQRALILEAFSGDDVVGDFSKEKNAKVVSEAPQVKDYTLPGWGEWSGVGIAPNPRKRHWFTIQASPVVPRKDRSLPHIILSEKRNAALAQHQVAEVPYPFNTAADFEQSLHGPLSTTWIPSQAARLLNQPRVHTQMGAIIKPISAEEIFGDAGRHGH